MLISKFVRLAARLLFFIALLVTLWGTLTPSVPAPPGSDKMHHIITFAGLTWLSLLGFPKLSDLWRAFIMLFIGGVIEILQGLLPIGRSADLFDFVADGVGVLAAIVATQIYSAALQRWTNKSGLR